MKDGAGQRNTLYGFSIKDVHSWAGMEGLFTECDLLFDGRTVGHCVLDGDGSCNHFDFPTAALNHAIAVQAEGLPEYARSEAYGEPWALSWLVAMLADWQDAGRRSLKDGNPIACQKELDDIGHYRKKIDGLRTSHCRLQNA